VNFQEWVKGMTARDDRTQAIKYRLLIGDVKLFWVKYGEVWVFHSRLNLWTME